MSRCLLDCSLDWHYHTTGIHSSPTGDLPLARPPCFVVSRCGINMKTVLTWMLCLWWCWCTAAQVATAEHSRPVGILPRGGSSPSANNPLPGRALWGKPAPPKTSSTTTTLSNPQQQQQQSEAATKDVLDAFLTRDSRNSFIGTCDDTSQCALARTACQPCDVSHTKYTHCNTHTYTQRTNDSPRLRHFGRPIGIYRRHCLPLWAYSELDALDAHGGDARTRRTDPVLTH